MYFAPMFIVSMIVLLVVSYFKGKEYDEYPGYEEAGLTVEQWRGLTRFERKTVWRLINDV